MEEIYSPAEDSFLLKKFVEEEIKDIADRSEKKILDMGSGSGIQASAAISEGIKPQNATLIDKNPSAIKHLKKKFPSSRVISSDLFSKIPKDKFDIIIFNPPYLPEDKFDHGIDTTGGKKGSETINLFLEQSKNYLKEGGIILLLTSNLTKGISWKGYKKTLLGKKKLFFEELYVWKLFSL